MVDAAFPEYVEAFIEETKRYLELLDSKPELVKETAENQSRVYQIPRDDGPVDLIVHRTERSLDRSIGEFRCRVHAKIRPELTEFLRGKAPLFNRFATLGSLVTDDDHAYVLSQCLIRPAVTTTLAGILAAAIVHARPSILEFYSSDAQPRAGAHHRNAQRMGRPRFRADFSTTTLIWDSELIASEDGR